MNKKLAYYREKPIEKALIYSMKSALDKS